MTRVKFEDLGKEIAKALEGYPDELKGLIEKEAEKVANQSVRELKQTSPKRTGEYAKSWGRVKSKSGMGYIVRARAPHYRLTHLLEKGHANRDGTRTEGIPHIQPVEEKASKEFFERVKRVIK